MLTKYLARVANRMQPFVAAFMITVMIFSTFAVAVQVYGQAVTLTATIQTSLTFTTGGSGAFGTVTPGTPAFATTSLAVTTNDTNGWNVTLFGNYKKTGQNNMQLIAATSSQVTDQTEWIPGAGTTTPGNATTTANLANSGNVLAFRVLTASTTNGLSFYAPTWWGANDNAGTALWAGISSSTVLRKIGDAGGGSPGTYSASPHYNDVVYYLNVSTSQPTGAYSAPLTFSATGD